jgi:choline-sulfatase
VGKLDLAKPDSYNGRNGDRPRVYGWGFTHPVECEGKMHAGMNDEPRGPYGFWLQERGLYDAFRADYKQRAARGWIKEASHDSVLPADAFEDAYIGQRSVEWIETIPDDYPWHLFVSFVGPHDPFDPPSEYSDRYRHAEMPPPIESSRSSKPDWVNNRRVDMTAEEVAHTRRQYCGATELIDDQVGAIIDAVARRGMMDNTYIIFASDHGEMLGDHGLYTKSLPYEASIRVPLIVTGPGINGRHTSDALVELIDVNPTICSLAGLPPQDGIDARSFGDILLNDVQTHREEAVSAIRNFRLIRTQDYKLIQHENDITELYDLRNDPDELHSVSKDHPEVVRDLQSRLGSRFQFLP